MSFNEFRQNTDIKFNGHVHIYLNGWIIADFESGKHCRAGHLEVMNPVLF